MRKLTTQNINILSLNALEIFTKSSNLKTAITEILRESQFETKKSVQNQINEQIVEEFTNIKSILEIKKNELEQFERQLREREADI